jgi:hypothetical protein
VTDHAKLYAWRPSGQLVLVRDGNGPYTCVASGSASLRFGKPPLSYPDPFCADPHASAFIQAFWTEEDPDPTAAPVPGTDDPMHPLTLWMRARGTAIGHAPRHVPAVVHQTLMAMPPAFAQ